MKEQIEMLDNVQKAMLNQMDLFKKSISENKDEEKRNKILNLYNEMMNCLNTGQSPFIYLEQITQEMQNL